MNALDMINWFDTLFKVSMGLAIVGFSLAVFFFFYFDIRKIRLLMSGKGRVKLVKKVEERHAKTEGLRPKAIPGMSGETNYQNGNAITAHVSYQQQDEPLTGVLQNAVPGTVVLNQESAETTFLNRQETFANQSVQICVNFQLTETTMVIHTDEII